MSKKLIVIVVLLILGAGVINYVLSESGVMIRSQKPEAAKRSAAKASDLPQVPCSRQPLSEVTEGPYYTPNSPQKTDLYEEGIVGEKIVLTGYVLDTECRPIVNTWLDFWQADRTGEYDNTGYTLRGHQFTDNEGKYTLTTVIPGEYPGRTPHIHVKVRATDESPIITSQLFFPDIVQNQGDFVYDPSLEVVMSDTGVEKQATYNFVVNR